MTGLFQDLRYALRQLRKNPGFTTVAVTTLALGIGANTAVFSVINAVMLRPLPYYQPRRLIEAQSVSLHNPAPDSLSYPDFFDWRAQNHTLAHLVSYHDTSFTLTGPQSPLHVDGQVVSWDLLPALGIHPEIGRGFAPNEERPGTRVVLISHAMWESQFGLDQSILGRSVNLSGSLFTIIGVMPPSFRFPVTAPQDAIWTTLAVDNDPSDPNPPANNRGMHFLNAIGRMKPEVAAGEVDQDLKMIAANLAKQYPATNTRHDSAKVQTELTALVGEARASLFVVLGAVLLVLLIASGNIANLLLARVRERRREIAMRSALGAERGQLLRQLLVESVTLSAVGGLAGCGLAFICTPAMLSLIGNSVPRAADAGVDLHVLSFAVVLSFATGLIFGIIPAVAASKTDLLATLKAGGRNDNAGHDWFRSSLIVGQVAMGLVLTMGAGLLVTSFANLSHANHGFNPEHLLTLFFETPDSRYKEARPQFYREYFDRLRTLPGVQSAAGAMFPPMANDDAVISFEDPEHPVAEGQRPAADFSPITPEYFSTMQIPLLEGRDFSDRDDTKSPQVLIVNQAFAQKYFPGEEALGKKLKPGAGNGTPGGPPWREVVGVVGNIRLEATQRDMRPAMYAPASQLKTWCCLYSVVRTRIPPLGVEPDIRQLVSAMDKEIPVTQVRQMKELISGQLAQPRFAMVLLGTFAGLAIMLTIVGLYGVMTYIVSRRTREIGIRMALGAQRGMVLMMVLRSAVVLLAAGIAIGVVAALASASALQSMLYGIGSHNSVVLALVCIAMALAGLAAAYIPAFRAAKVDPMVALRYE
jgi:putative ABC transport system permease protein